MQFLGFAFFLKTPHDSSMSKIAAVLTGDLIASTNARAASVDRAMSVLSATAQSLHHPELAQDPTRFTRSRGDGWQLYLSPPGLILRASLMLAANLRASGIGLATRISIGVGTINDLGATGLSAASGAAFTLSGRGLDTMAKSRRIAITGAGAAEKWQSALFDLTDWHARRWSREQAEAVAQFLIAGDTPHADTAERLGITRQAYEARLKSAGALAMGSALHAFASHDFQAAPP